MDITLLAVVVFGALVAYLVGRAHGRANGFWEGRLSGWKACEEMVMDRARKNPKYNDSELWEDLIQ